MDSDTQTIDLAAGASTTVTFNNWSVDGDPATLHQLLETLALSVADYLNAQVAAGAQAIMIFDTWGGALTPEAYREFSLDYMAKIVENLNREAAVNLV